MLLCHEILNRGNYSGLALAAAEFLARVAGASAV
jgi:hypothetical protein